MAKWRWIVLFGGLGCSPVRKIPAPDPPPSVLPPIQARAHYVRGQIWLARGNLEHAQIAFERARVFDPKSPQILHAMSRVALNSGDTELARQKMADAALVGGEEPEYWLEHGRLEMAFGERKVAINALKRAVSLGAGWQAKAALIADGLRHEGKSRLLEDWVELDISDPAERRRRADLRLMAGDRKGAVRDYMDVLSRSGRDLSLVTPIVSGASQAGQLASTLLEAELLCLKHPQSSAAWMVVGLISQMVGDAEAAVQAIERAQDLGVVLSEGSQAVLDKAKIQLEHSGVPSSGKAPLLDDPVSRIIRLVQQKRWDDGESRIEQELLRTPEDPRLHYILGEIRLKRDGPAAAQGPIEKVLSIQPSYGPALNMWAWIQAEQGIELDEAEIRVMQALNRQPGMASYWDTLGWILHLRGQHQKARIVLSRALRMSPKDDTVRKHFETCLSHEAEKAP